MGWSLVSLRILSGVSESNSTADTINLVGAFFGLVAGFLSILLLVRNGHKLGVSVGAGGSLILLGLITLAIAYDQLHGISIWISTIGVLFILASSCYAVLKKEERVDPGR